MVRLRSCAVDLSRGVTLEVVHQAASLVALGEPRAVGGDSHVDHIPHVLVALDDGDGGLVSADSMPTDTGTQCVGSERWGVGGR